MYLIARTIYEPADHLADDDVMSMSDAARMLKVRYSTIHGHMLSGKLTIVIDDEAATTSHGRTRRFLLRAEVEALATSRNT
jgi:hypothetical protein